MSIFEYGLPNSTHYPRGAGKFLTTYPYDDEHVWIDRSDRVLDCSLRSGTLLVSADAWRPAAR